MVIHVAPLFYDCACELMAENDRGVIAERVVENVKVGSTDSTIGNFELDFAVPAARFLYFPYADVAFATRVFNQSFHVGRSLSRRLK
jgi:hypothetical protein